MKASDPLSLKVLEAVALVRFSEMSVDEAATLVCLPRTLVVDNLDTGKVLPYTHSPNQIALACKVFREEKRRRGEPQREYIY